MRSFPLLVVALLLAALAVASPAVAKQPHNHKLDPVHGRLQARIGIADQKTEFFTDPRFQSLGLKTARRSVAWDAMRYDWQVADIDAWLNAARQNGVTPVITFDRSRVQSKRHVVPTAAQMRTSFVAFHQRYPWVTDYVASNESNHFGEPTGRRPALAARYYKAMRRACPSCRIAAATLLDFPNLVSWTKAFVKAAHEQPKYWALHNYISANRFDPARTKQLLQTVKGQVWITEVGGLVKRRTADRAGKAKLREGVQHAADVTSYILNGLARVSPRITRVYLYHWNSDGPRSTWDSGFVDASGKTRPAYGVLQRFLRGSRTGAGLAEKAGKGPKQHRR